MSVLGRRRHCNQAKNAWQLNPWRLHSSYYLTSWQMPSTQAYTRIHSEAYTAAHLTTQIICLNSSPRAIRARSRPYYRRSKLAFLSSFSPVPTYTWFAPYQYGKFVISNISPKFQNQLKRHKRQKCWKSFRF